MRLFVALDLDDAIRHKLKRFSDQMRDSAPNARWVGDDSFHITLKFIGSVAPEQAERIKEALAAVTSPAFPVGVRGCGFFPDRGTARVFWAGVQAPDSLTHLAHAIDAALAQLGVPAEKGPLHPHVTLARAGSGRPGRAGNDRPNARFQVLQEKLASAANPDFGSFTPREIFLYESRLSPEGPRYGKLKSFSLRA